MYEIQYRTYFWDPYPNWLRTHLRLPSGLRTLEEAKEARVVSGDLVIDSDSGKIVTDPAWLWDWEVRDADSYAQRAIAWQNKKTP